MNTTTFETLEEDFPSALAETINELDYVLAEPLTTEPITEAVQSEPVHETYLCIDGVLTALSRADPELQRLFKHRRSVVARSAAMTIENAHRMTVAEVNQRYLNIQNSGQV